MEKKSKGRIGITLVILSLGFIHLFPFQKKTHAEIEDLIIHQRRIERLEKDVNVLTALNQSMHEEIRKLNRMVEDSLVKKHHMEKVKRIGGRPHEKDTMVSVAGILALWNQIDILMVKLDEIIAKFSP